MDTYTLDDDLFPIEEADDNVDPIQPESGWAPCW